VSDVDDQPKPRLRLQSTGAGVQSTAMALLIIQGKIPPIDGAIFADTGWEPQAVYDHLDRMEREIYKPAGIPLYRVTAGNIRNDALDPDHRFASMPLFVRNPDGSGGMARRQCTSEYKLKPIKRKVRELLGYPHPTPVPRGVFVEQLVGISSDEVQRAKDSGIKYAVNTHPLLDLGISRRDCLRILHAAGWETTPKSACVGCPFHGNAQWRRMRDEQPAEWADAVAFDAEIRNGSARANANGHELRGSMYLHRSLLPLADAPVDRVTRAEHAAGQLTITDLVADMEAGVDIDAYDFEHGCGPWSCRSDGA
jgi:hypothetical protein